MQGPSSTPATRLCNTNKLKLRTLYGIYACSWRQAHAHPEALQWQPASHSKWQQFAPSPLSAAPDPAPALRSCPTGRSRTNRLLCAIMKLKNQLLLCRIQGRHRHREGQYIMPLAEQSRARHNTISSIHRKKEIQGKMGTRWLGNCPSEAFGSTSSSNYGIWHNLKLSRSPLTDYVDESIYIVRSQVLGVAERAFPLVRG